MFERFREILPGGEICQSYTTAPDLAAWEGGRTAAAVQQAEAFVSIHTSAGFVGYLAAPLPKNTTTSKQEKKQQLLSVRPNNDDDVVPKQDDDVSGGVVQKPRKKKKFCRRCQHCYQRFAEFVPWLHHNCLAEKGAVMACKICGKEYQEEKNLFGHCSASLGGPPHSNFLKIKSLNQCFGIHIYYADPVPLHFTLLM